MKSNKNERDYIRKGGQKYFAMVRIKLYLHKEKETLESSCGLKYTEHFQYQDLSQANGEFCFVSMFL